MIVIVSRNTVKEGKVEEFKKLTVDLIEKSQKEEGCIEYNLYQDIKNPRTLTFIEKWESEKSFEEHKNSEHFISIVPKIKELNESGELSLYDLAHK